MVLVKKPRTYGAVLDTHDQITTTTLLITWQGAWLLIESVVNIVPNLVPSVVIFERVR